MTVYWKISVLRALFSLEWKRKRKKKLNVFSLCSHLHSYPHAPSYTQTRTLCLIMMTKRSQNQVWQKKSPECTNARNARIYSVKPVLPICDLLYSARSLSCSLFRSSFIFFLSLSRSLHSFNLSAYYAKFALIIGKNTH